MFENIINFFKNIGKKEDKKQSEENSKNAAKERLHLVLMQDRANVSADFLELMKQEIIDVIKKYIEVDEKEIDVRLTNKENEDGTNGAPALYANIPILNIKNDARKIGKKEVEEKVEHVEKVEHKKQEENEENKEEKENKQEETEKTEKNIEKEETEQIKNSEKNIKKTEKIEDEKQEEKAQEIIKEVIEEVEKQETVKSKK